MSFLKKKDKKRFNFDNYQPNESTYHQPTDATMPMPVGGIISEVNQRLREQEKIEEKLGFIERVKISLNKLWIRFSKLYVFVLAPITFALERFYWHRYNFGIFIGTYIIAILLAPTALKNLFKKKK